MDKKIRQRSLYEINTRVWLRNFDANGKKATLKDVPDNYWDELAEVGIENIWLMGVWATPEAAIKKYCLEPFLIDEYKKALKDFTYKDVIGSPYSIEDYIIAESVVGVGIVKRSSTPRLPTSLRFVGIHPSHERGIFLKPSRHCYVKSQVK